MLLACLISVTVDFSVGGCPRRQLFCICFGYLMSTKKSLVIPILFEQLRQLLECRYSNSWQTCNEEKGFLYS